MKILKSQLKRIIKEELEKMVSEVEEMPPEAEPEGYGVFFGKRDVPHERKRFRTRAEAEAAMAALRQQSPYSSRSFDPGGRYGIEVRPYNPPPEAPIQREPVDYWVEQGMGRWFGPYEDQNVASRSHDRGYIREFPKGQKPPGY